MAIENLIHWVSSSCRRRRPARSRRSLVLVALLSRFAGTYSCAVIRLKSGGRRAAEYRKTEETEERDTEGSCLKRRTKWGTQRCGTRIPRVMGLARAPGMHRSLSLSLPLSLSAVPLSVSF